MNSKKAKLIRKLINELAGTAAPDFKGRAPNDKYLRYGGSSAIFLDPLTPRAIYLRAKRNEWNRRHPGAEASQVRRFPKQRSDSPKPKVSVEPASELAGIGP